jgi:coenzyme F420-reducing hydrogenase delta subunit
MKSEIDLTLALFYCRNVPGSSNEERRDLELKYGSRVRFFPIPCSGRLESLHLLRALESFADAAYVVTCPEGMCRYFEGNRRARKRVERARSIIKSIGLEEERAGIIVNSKEKTKNLATVTEEILERISALGVSKAHRNVA